MIKKYFEAWVIRTHDGWFRNDCWFEHKTEAQRQAQYKDKVEHVIITVEPMSTIEND